MEKESEKEQEKKGDTDLSRKEEEKRAYYLNVAKEIAEKNADNFPSLQYSVHWIYDR